MNFKDYKGLAKVTKDAATNEEKTFERDAQRAVDDPNNTATEEKQVGESTIRSASAEARKQISEEVDEVAKRTEALMEKAARARRAVEGKPWPFWKKGLVVAGTTLGATYLLTVALAFTPDAERAAQEKQMRAAQAWADYDQKVAEQNSSIILNLQKYNDAMSAMRSAPPPTPPPDLPAPVAAIYDVPVEVTVTENKSDSAPETFATTIGQVYQANPQARQQIVQDAPRIQHDYDKDDPNSCYHTHCLDQNHKQWEVNGFDGKAYKFKY